MADIPDIPPLKPAWPTRPDDRNPTPRRQQGDESKREKQPSDKRKPDDGHIDEYA